ncbi:hypothetical protein K439DRAFT_1074068 [Ramaria rubella]|nr:hypothetical protein K439DRAFT_1074068 [Ramaria rubella]
MSTLPPEIQELVDLYDELDAAGWWQDNGDLSNMANGVQEVGTLKGLDYGLENSLNGATPSYPDFPIVAEGDACACTGSTSALLPVPVQQQFYAMHMASHIPEPLGSMSTIEPYLLGGSDEPGIHAWPDMCEPEQDWYVLPKAMLRKSA